MATPDQLPKPTPGQDVSHFSVSSASLLSGCDGHGGEYAAASRSDNHIYYGIDGRPLAPSDGILRSSPPDWKPIPLRWPFMTFMVVTLLGLIAGTEYAIRVLPAEVNRSEIPLAPHRPPQPGTGPPPISGEPRGPSRRLVRMAAVRRAEVDNLWVPELPPATTGAGTTTGTPVGSTDPAALQPSSAKRLALPAANNNMPQINPGSIGWFQPGPITLTTTSAAKGMKSDEPPHGLTPTVTPTSVDMAKEINGAITILDEPTTSPATTSSSETPPKTTPTTSSSPVSLSPPPTVTPSPTTTTEESPPPAPPATSPDTQPPTTSSQPPPPPVTSHGRDPHSTSSSTSTRSRTGSRSSSSKSNSSSNVTKHAATTPSSSTPQTHTPLPTGSGNITVPGTDVDVPVENGGGTTTDLKGSQILETFTLVLPVIKVTTVELATKTVVTTTISGQQSLTTLATTLRGVTTTITSSTTVQAVASPITVVYITAETATRTNDHGSTLLQVLTPPPVVATMAFMLSDSAGRPTRTVTTTVTVKPRTLTLKNAAGVPTATITQYAALQARVTANTNPVLPGPPALAGPGVGYVVYSLSDGQYFAGFLLPTILGVLLMIPVRMIETSTRQLQPFHRLASSTGGAPARDSICMRTGLFHSIPAAFRTLVPSPSTPPAAGVRPPVAWYGRGWLGDPPVMFLTKLLLLTSTVLIPLFPEAVGLKLHGACRPDSVVGCAATLAVFPAPARAALGVLCFMAFLALVILVALLRWRTGVASSPWSIASIAALSSNPAVRALLRSLPRAGSGKKRRVTHKDLQRVAGDRHFRLGCFPSAKDDASGVVLMDYGIVICSEAGRPLNEEALRLGDNHGGDAEAEDEAVDTSASRLQAGDVDSFRAGGAGGWLGVKRLKPKRSQGSFSTRLAEAARRKEHHLPFLMMSHAPRLLFIALACGLLALIMYYKHTTGDSGFETFMSHQTFGVRFLFTVVGVGIAFFWSSFFTNVAIVSPYLVLSGSPQDARRSVLMTPPTNAFAGLWHAVRRRHWFLAATAFTACLGEFMPILLINVPYRVTMTLMISHVCTYASAAILVIMVAVVVASFFVAWPHMPVDPSSPAGAAYYLCDSYILAHTFAGTSLLVENIRDPAIEKLNLRYEFGVIDGGTGGQRIGVEVDQAATVAAADTAVV